MPIGGRGARMRRGCHQKRPDGRSKNIWPCSTMRPSALRPMWCPSSSRRPIRQRDGPEPKLRSHTCSRGSVMSLRHSHVSRHGGQAFFAYYTNYLIDVDNGIIVDVEATTAIRQAEVLAAKRMIERSIDRFDLYPARLLGDSAYGSAEMLGWLVYEHGIEPHVTVFDKSMRQDGTFSRDDFIYDHVGDVYTCPAGKMLTTTGSRVDGATLRYRASKYDCQVCRLKPRCCPKEPARYVPRS